MNIIGISPLKSGQVKLEDAPRTDTERRLAEIWAGVFGLERVGRHDDFFDLGGHSLLAARIAAEVEGVFGVPLPLIALFHAPTVARLAGRLDAGLEWSPLVPLQPGGHRPPLFCVHGQGGHVLRLRLLADLLGPDQPFYGLEARSMGGQSPPASTVEAMADDYLPEVRRTQPHGPYYLGGFSFGGSVALEMARRLEAEGETVALLVLLDCHAPLPKRPTIAWLAQGALWRAREELKRASGSPSRYVRQAAARLRRGLGNRGGLLPLGQPAVARRPAVGGVGTLTTEEACNQAVVDYRALPFSGEALLLEAERGRRRRGRDSRWWAHPRWWDTYVGMLDIRSVPGGHLSMLEPPQVETTARVLRDALAASQSRRQDVA